MIIITNVIEGVVCVRYCAKGFTWLIRLILRTIIVLSEVR